MVRADVQQSRRRDGKGAPCRSVAIKVFADRGNGGMAVDSAMHLGQGKRTSDLPVFKSIQTIAIVPFAALRAQ